MPTSQPFEVRMPLPHGEMASKFVGGLWAMAAGLPWGGDGILVVGVAARLIVGKPLGR